jgi:hypothetical protein
MSKLIIHDKSQLKHKTLAPPALATRPEGGLLLAYVTDNKSSGNIILAQIVEGVARNPEIAVTRSKNIRRPCSILSVPGAAQGEKPTTFIAYQDVSSSGGPVMEVKSFQGTLNNNPYDYPPISIASARATPPNLAWSRKLGKIYLEWATVETADKDKTEIITNYSSFTANSKSITSEWFSKKFPVNKSQICIQIFYPPNTSSMQYIDCGVQSQDIYSHSRDFAISQSEWNKFEPISIPSPGAKTSSRPTTVNFGQTSYLFWKGPTDGVDDCWYSWLLDGTTTPSKWAAPQPLGFKSRFAPAVAVMGHDAKTLGLVWVDGESTDGTIAYTTAVPEPTKAML